MSSAIFLRLLGESDKGAGLARAVGTLRDGKRLEAVSYEVDPNAFREVPGTPFAYWVSDRIRHLFKAFPPFEGDGRTVRAGLQTSDDFRFIRAWWEVPAERILGASGGPSWRDDLPGFQEWCRRRTFEGKAWIPHAKGGEYSPFYSDIHLVVNWERDGEEMKAWAVTVPGNAHWSRNIRSAEYYFRPGLTWPERTTSGYCPQAMPAGVIFNVKGQAMLPTDSQLLAPLLAVHSTRVFAYLEELMIGLGEEAVSGSAARDYTGGTVKRLPFPEKMIRDFRETFEAVSIEITTDRRLDQATDECSLAHSPTTQHGGSIVESASSALDKRLGVWLHHLDHAGHVETTVRDYFRLEPKDIREIRSVVGPHPVVDLSPTEPRSIKEAVKDSLDRPIDALIDEAVTSGLASRSITKKSFFVSRLHELLAQRFGCSALSVIEAHRQLGKLPVQELEEHARKLVSTMVGMAFGRWDVRLARDQSLISKLPGPFDPLPVCPPGMLVGSDGLPARPSNIASESWLRARPEASRLPPPGGVEMAVIRETDYPVRVPWDGILVNDPLILGEMPADLDLARRVRGVMEVVFGERVADMEAELCQLLDVRELRDYLWPANMFFADHLSRYSRSRRKSPIYWPLSTQAEGYTVWIYYPRLADDTLYRAVTHHVEPKLAQVDQRLSQIFGQQRSATGREGARLAQEAGELTGLRDELRKLREELLRVAQLPYKPCLDDGVQITAAPLWQLFCHRPWRKTLEDTWKELEHSDYDWAHLAMAIWPERVRERCQSDRSLAIAHGIEVAADGAAASAGLPHSRKKRSGKK